MELISSRKMRAGVGRFEAAGAVVDGAGERAADVAEELAFEQAFAQRAAVDADERAVAALAEVVDGVGDELLAGAGFAEEQSTDARLRATWRVRRQTSIIGAAGADDARERLNGGAVGVRGSTHGLGRFSGSTRRAGREQGGLRDG